MIEMAGDWMPIRLDLPRDVAIIAMSCQLKIHEDCVLGKVIRLWCWANEQLADGNASSVTKKWVDRYVECDGFANALENVGWLASRDGYLAFPNWDVWMSGSAKKRLQNAKRQRSFKQKQSGKSGSQKGNAGSVTASYSLFKEEEKKDVSLCQSQFDKLWQTFPKRKGRLRGKSKSLARFQRYSSAKREQILAAVANYAEHIELSGEFAKDPERFLIEDVWTEFIEPVDPKDYERMIDHDPDRAALERHKRHIAAEQSRWETEQERRQRGSVADVSDAEVSDAFNRAVHNISRGSDET